jgi:hypothetical protein
MTATGTLLPKEVQYSWVLVAGLCIEVCWLNTLEYCTHMLRGRTVEGETVGSDQERESITGWCFLRWEIGLRYDMRYASKIVHVRIAGRFRQRAITFKSDCSFDSFERSSAMRVA